MCRRPGPVRRPPRASKTSGVNPSRGQLLRVVRAQPCTVILARYCEGDGASRRLEPIQAPPGGILSFTRLMGLKKLNSGRLGVLSMPRKKVSERPSRMTSPVPSTSSPSCAASRNSQANDTVTAGLAAGGGGRRRRTGHSWQPPSSSRTLRALLRCFFSTRQAQRIEPSS